MRSDVAVLFTFNRALPVDIEHNQCPCRFFDPRRNTSVCGHNATPQRYYVWRVFAVCVFDTVVVSTGHQMTDNTPSDVTLLGLIF